MASRTPPRRPGRPKQPIARPVLLAKARAAFAEAGYAGASMGLIAERVGLRKSSLFHHFGSKEQLYLEVMEGLLAELGALLPAAMSRTTFPERLDCLSELVSGYLGAHPHAARLLVRELVGHGAVLPEGIRDSVTAVLQATAAFIEQGMEEGAIPPQDPRQVAVSLIGVHLLHYAAPGVSGLMMGGSIFDDAAVEERIAASVRHARGVCGLGAPA